MASSPTKAYVLPIAGYDVTLETLKKLILAGGCDIVCAEDPADAHEQCVEGADVLVILICPETMDNEAVNHVIALAKKLAKQVVGVWASKDQVDKTPSFLHRHGYATVSMNPDSIAAAICGGQPIWESPGGGIRPKPPTPRYKGH